MTASRRQKNLLIALAAALAATALVAAAIGAVIVYDNDFSSRAEFGEVEKSGGGKRCDRRYREKSEAMRASVERGPAICSYRPPVQGDDELADQDVRLDAKILKSTEKSVRKGAFIELSVRSGSGAGYSLRVFPRRRRFELARAPGGQGDFPVAARSEAINGINERNRLQLVADGSVIRALANGEQLARVSDGDPGQVTGRRIRFAVGSEKDSKKDVAAAFKEISVGVPTR